VLFERDRVKDSKQRDRVFFYIYFKKSVKCLLHIYSLFFVAEKFLYFLNSRAFAGIEKNI